MKVLVVEDEPRLTLQLERMLQGAGYAVDKAYDGEAALHLGETEDYDAVVLDLGLPRLDGVTVLERWREAGRSMPVLVLTARDGWTEKVRGLDAGADDYLTKPFNAEELLARLRALIRRSTGQAQPVVSIGPVTLDPRAARVTLNGQPVALTGHEYRVLSYLMHHAGKTVSRSELIEHVYAQDFDRDSNTIEVFGRSPAPQAGRRPDRNRAWPRLPGTGGVKVGWRRPASLRLRVAVGAVLWISAALAAGGFVLVELFREHVEAQAEAALVQNLEQLVAVLVVGPDEAVTVARTLSDPRFQRPFSGLYWQVGEAEEPVARSRSLWDAVLPVPGDTVPTGGLHVHRLSGPRDEVLLTVERAVTLPGRDAPVRIAVAQDAAELSAAVTRFSRDLFIAFLVLGGALALAAVGQAVLVLQPVEAVRRRVLAVREGKAERVTGAGPRKSSRWLTT